MIAVGKITDPGIKNSTAAKCAVKLAQLGDTKNATAVAHIISDPGIKNEVLAKIAKDGK